MQNAFAVVQDKNEITLIMEESMIERDSAIEINGAWKILTFDGVLPFDLVGFISKISTALAGEGVSIFVISAYSTDHILVKNKDLNKAIDSLKRLGFDIKR